MAVDDKARIQPTATPTRHGRQRQADLQPAQPQKFMAQLPQHFRREFQTDQKQHHHHAEFGNMLN